MSNNVEKDALPAGASPSIETNFVLATYGALSFFLIYLVQIAFKGKLDSEEAKLFAASAPVAATIITRILIYFLQKLIVKDARKSVRADLASNIKAINLKYKSIFKENKKLLNSFRQELAAASNEREKEIIQEKINELHIKMSEREEKKSEEIENLKISQTKEQFENLKNAKDIINSSERE